MASLTREPVALRVWRYVDPAGDCWEWTGSKLGSGYGHVYTVMDGARPVYRAAHRVIYELLVGPIPDGMQLDHLCRNRACVNPDHLEPVTPAENQRRVPMAKARRTHCVRGHAFSPENTWTSSRNQRYCKACDRDRKRAARHCQDDEAE